jgi:transcriptional regulator with XRE-family HTH domain
MERGIGAKLRGIRRRWRLSLREVEQRSFRVAEQRGSESYQISASWLDRLEREQHELTVNKMIALAEIYNIPAEQLIRLAYPGKDQSFVFNQLAISEAVLLSGESRDNEFEALLADSLLPTPCVGEEGLLLAEDANAISPYRVGIIGKRDLTLDPMVPPGSVVLIDTRNRDICPRKDWVREFQRPIYFLMTRESYFCGWCELEEDSQRLTLIPHPLSRAPSRRWVYKTEIENLGRVVMVAIQMNA